jgi:alkylation response protein AidB-like acyl-CoA dehydrogenase
VADGVGLRARSGSSDLAERARACAGDVSSSLVLAKALGTELPLPGGGDTLTLWESLATLGAVDLTVARVVEPHLDAVAILAQAGLSVPCGSTWGVYAAEGGPRLHATKSVDGWTLSGTKPWCSLADRVSHALVTAWVDDSRRGLFSVELAHPGVRPLEGAWASRGLAEVRSTGIELEAVPASPVGEPGWYLDRPGFAWGGIGVAAIWFGGAVAVGRRLRAAALQREPDQVALAHLGAVDVALTRARAVLIDAVGVADGPAVGRDVAALLALRVRHVVADTVEEVLSRTARALGPAPLALEEEHARRVADLMLYVRQHHAERDSVALGRAIMTDGAEGEWSWW